ncbi:MAG: hypothetical protein ABSG98_07835 [Anaerolineales bacterium]|jgi:hypothetical protein
MNTGTPIHREWVYALQDGTVVVDWGEGTLQDIVTGDFLREGKFGHELQDHELENLRNSGYIGDFDSRNVYLRPLPEIKRPTLD